MIRADFDVEFAEALKLGEVEFLLRLKGIFFIGFTLGGEKQDVDKCRGVNADELDDLASADARKKHQTGPGQRRPKLRG